MGLGRFLGCGSLNLAALVDIHFVDQILSAPLHASGWSEAALPQKSLSFTPGFSLVT